MAVWAGLQWQVGGRLGSPVEVEVMADVLGTWLLS